MAVRVQGGTRRGLRRGALVIAAVVAVVAPLAACAGKQVEGKASPMAEIDGSDAGGVEASDDGPSGPRDGAPDPSIEVENTDNGDMDKIAAGAVEDLYEYWGEQLPKDFDQDFVKADRLVSYDSAGDPLTLCGASTAEYVNAFYCNDGTETMIAWDRGVLLPQLNEMFGPMSVVGVLAHEMGHAVQDQLGEKSNIDQSTPTILFEQQADCYMGNFMRYVVDGDSKYFQLNTGEGLNKILATLFFIRDPAGYDGTTEPSAHGLAFDRVYAFQQGFSNDPKRCADMDMDEINKRITETEPDESDTGDVEVNDEYLGLLQDSLDQAFSDNGGKVEVKLEDSGSKCDKGKATEPATYCPDSKTVSFDVEALNKIAQPLPQPPEPIEEGDGIGDFAAFAEIASRYALGVQDAVGAPLDDENAGLRTACLTGAWAQFSNPLVNTDKANQPKLLLSTGDLDEAVAELLQEKSLIAADVNGKQVASGFARVEAFALGYNEGAEKCTEGASEDK
jgi:predicted metalloprotease